MARLNEAPQPAVESIDACGLSASEAVSAECLHWTVKRRFVRQNREIARYALITNLTDYTNPSQGQFYAVPPHT